MNEHVPAAELTTHKAVEVVTFGCRLNTYESNIIEREAIAAGAENTIIINTCAVTNEAVRQAKQAIRRLRRERPDAKIVVTGCAAQIETNAFSAMDEVNLVLGNQEKMERTSYAPLNLDIPATERVRVNDIMEIRETAAHMMKSTGTRARAFVQVQNGCDHRCTFCIIPFGRGPARSVPIAEAVREIQSLVDSGTLEVVLTGVDLTDYGKDLPGAPKLGTLVQAILTHVPDLKRLRISSLDAVEIDTPLMDAIASEARIMPHVHLSLQAGDDMILKRMKRRHLRADAIRVCEELRARRPDIVFGADIIAGFPTETDEMFENTLKCVDECGLTLLHIFPFSPRKGTPAARMPQLHGSIIKSRAAILRAKGDECLAAYLATQTGKTHDILVERPTFGRIDSFIPVRLLEPAEPNTLITRPIASHNGKMLEA